MRLSPALRWLLVVPAGLAGFLLGQALFYCLQGLGDLFPPVYFAAFVLSNVASSSLTILFGANAAPAHRMQVSVVLSMVMCLWYGVLLGAAPYNPVAEHHSQSIVSLTCLLGLASSILACWLVCRKPRSGLYTPGWPSGGEFGAPDGEHDFDEYEVPFDYDPEDESERIREFRSTLSFAQPVRSGSETQQMFFTSDLILLESELFRIQPCRESYISAIRLGLAIEKDSGYCDSQGHYLTFSQLMRDVAMRLSVANQSEEAHWLSVADHFRLYQKEEEECVRRDLLKRVDAMLPRLSLVRDGAEAQVA